MKYIIIGKQKRQGIPGNDLTRWDLNEYTELGWELMAFRTELIKSYCLGEISKDDTIITHPDRKCLYTKIFSNVSDKMTESSFEIIDFVEKCHRSFSNTTSDFSKYKDLILNVDFDNLFDCQQKFVGVAARFRDWWSFSNVAYDFWKNFIESLTKNGIKVFVFGKTSESLADGVNSHHVNLRDWCSLMHHPNCLGVFGPMSGAMVIGQICCNNKLIVIDHNNLMKTHGNGPNHPLYFGDCVNFINVPITFINHMPTTEELMKYV